MHTCLPVRGRAPYPLTDRTRPPGGRSQKGLLAPSQHAFEGRFWVLFGYNFTAPMGVSAKLAALTSALGPYGHVRPGRAAETPGFAFYIRGADFHHFLQNRPRRGTTDPRDRSTDGAAVSHRWREPNPAARHSSVRLRLPSLAFDLRVSESPLAVRPTTTTTTTTTPNEIHRRRHQQRRGGRRTHWT